MVSTGIFSGNSSKVVGVYVMVSQYGHKGDFLHPGEAY